MIRAPSLDLPDISHAFFTREGGISRGLYASLNGGQGSGDDPHHVRENRKRMSAALGVEPDALVTCYQIHSPEVIVVDEPWDANDRPKADGLVTARQGIALGVASADCGPVLFADSEAQVVGACHAGWKGAFTGVLESTIQAMEALGAERSAIVAVLGPTISRHAYEVGPEFVLRFREADEANLRFFTPSDRPAHAFFDLPGYIIMRLDNAAVGRVVDLALCTYADPARFFSYRRSVHHGEPDYGRLISAIALTP
jgi:polyphenol oxidase